MEQHKPFDVDGKAIKVGDVVRVIGIPDSMNWGPNLKKDSLPVFSHIVGKLYRIESFDEYGCAELFFTIFYGRYRGMHSVAIEPYLLKSATWMNAAKRVRFGNA